MAADTTGKRRSLAANSLFSVIAWIFPLLLGFFSTPILVRYLGNEQYGLFAIVLGFISYSFTFGIGKVAGKYVPEFRANRESEKVTQVIAGTFWLSLAVGVFGALVLIILAPTIVRSLLLISPDMQLAAMGSPMCSRFRVMSRDCRARCSKRWRWASRASRRMSTRFPKL